MANLLVALSHLRGIGTLGAKSSPSGGTINRKLAPAPRPFPSQIKLRFKIVANATGLPGGRITERKEPKASWWDKTPGQHTKAYIASFFPPGPNRQIEAQIVMHKVSIFWLTCVPVLVWRCPGLRIGYIPAFFVVATIAYAALFFDGFCAWRIEVREYKRERQMAQKQRAQRRGH